MPPLKVPLSPANTTQVVQEKNPTDRQTYWQTGVDRLLKAPTWDWPVLKQNGNLVLDQSNIGTDAGDLIAWAPGPKYPAGDGSLIFNLPVASVPGRWIAGTPLVITPVAFNTVLTQAHGLGQTPDAYTAYTQCLVAELGYAVGDRIYGYTPIFSSLAMWGGNATNTFIVITNNGFQLLSLTTKANANATPANWKMVITPYKLS